LSEGGEQFLEKFFGELVEGNLGHGVGSDREHRYYHGVS
jgi:hypothetical protein